MYGYVEFNIKKNPSNLFVFEGVAEDESIVHKVCIKFDESSVSVFLYCIT